MTLAGAVKESEVGFSAGESTGVKTSEPLTHVTDTDPVPGLTIVPV